ncbi:hypothetical protein GC098_02325 [Paenibacillus sp. LMG 31458]|uniref:Uncharacterized protein n=1 Tax=Paenibacillus phytorum TaxID=2654977 RepID=A0ABX1XPU3_9BACL|nr:hypothetical protein [Paenibacillus phytorum]
MLVGTVYADWAYAFVVYDGNTYVISKELVGQSQIGSLIGKVTKYSDREGTYSGNFSNRYPKGTEYYEIIGIKVHEAIAVKEKDGLFIKATYRGEYGGSRYDWISYLPYVIVVLLLLFGGFIMKRKFIR